MLAVMFGGTAAVIFAIVLLHRPDSGARGFFVFMLPPMAFFRFPYRISVALFEKVVRTGSQFSRGGRCTGREIESSKKKDLHRAGTGTRDGRVDAGAEVVLSARALGARAALESSFFE